MDDLEQRVARELSECGAAANWDHAIATARAVIPLVMEHCAGVADQVITDGQLSREVTAAIRQQSTALREAGEGRG